MAKKCKSNVIRAIRCPSCGYEWIPRVGNPKACPECKVRLGWYRKRRLAKV